MNVSQATALHAGLTAGLRAAITLAGLLAATCILAAGIRFAWHCWRQPPWPAEYEDTVREALTAELAELELQDIIRRGMP